ncbi:glycosyltransferase family 2 protein [Pontibacter sp. H249]|uniref:glycosyltransferase family 2 protein n=1 Tax=Pontibacter sp. H249 TaxID=3133420 RepID=UPI0030C0D35F
MCSYLISVIIPCYNAEAYIEQCLKSIYQQTYTNIEVICIDNNSTDNTLKKLYELKNLYPNLIVEEEKRPGASIARNKGLSIAKGELVQFQDADDLFMPNKFEKQILAFHDNTIDIVVSDRVVMNEECNKELEIHNFSEIEGHEIEVAVSEVIATGNPLYKREVLNRINGYNEDINSAQDWDLNIRLILNGAKIKYVPGPFFISRQIPNSLSSNWKKVSLQGAELLVSYRSRLENLELGVRAQNKICRVLYESILWSKDKPEIFINELLFWSEKNNLRYLSPIKRSIATVFGIRSLLNLERLKQNIL